MNQKEIKCLARPYARLIRWSDEDQCFIGSLPELDGDCTHGDTVEEVANENAIAQLRQSRGVTQKDFARLLGVSLSTLIKWESGQRRPSGSSARLLELVSKHPELLQA